MRWFVIQVWAVLLALPAAVQAIGHGPVFGMATPTLGRGSWSLDVGAMGRTGDGGRAAMVRPMLAYGVTEDVLVSVSLPMPLYTRPGLPPVRGVAMMPFALDIEFLAGWRFHRRGTAVGTRFESTAYVGFGYLTDAERKGVRTWPGLYAAVVTGYASRTIYAWARGGATTGI